MDFTKLSPLSKITDHARLFHDFLGDILEGDRELISESQHKTSKPHATPFVVRNDIESLLRLPSRGKTNFIFEQRFAELTPYFESGFLFSENRGAYALQSMFLFGQTFVPQAKSDAVPQRHLQKLLPKPSFDGVLRGRVTPLLKSFRLEALTSLHDADVFALAPKPGSLVLLVCNRPHPWQVGVMEAAHAILTQGLTK